MRHLELPIIKIEDEDIRDEFDIEIDDDLQDIDIQEELIGLGDLQFALKTLEDSQIYDKINLVIEEPICGVLDLSDKNKQIPEVTVQDNKVKENEKSQQKTNDVDWRKTWGFICQECNKSWYNKTIFDDHYRQHHGDTPVYMCPYCSQTTKKYTTFRAHCYRHSNEGKYKCSSCDKKYSRHSLLKDHMRLKHSELNLYSCNKCEKKFESNALLHTHKKNEHSEPPNLYPCEECGKILKSKGGLAAHLAVHKAGRRFVCHLCGKAYTQKINLKHHMREHIGYKNPYVCEICGKSFAERSYLTRHIQFHTDTRQWHCDICNRFYKTERCLKVHKLVHSDHRPHTCEFCGKGFLSSTKLKQHLNVHTGERPYKCSLCVRSFTNYSNWLKHIRRIHPLEAEELQKKWKDSVKLPSFESEFEPVFPLGLKKEFNDF